MIVLVVSEEIKVRKRISRLLEEYEVIESPNFLDAVGVVSQNYNDCCAVVVDYALKPFNGVELLNFVKKMKSNIHTILVMKEANAEAEMEGLNNEIELIIDCEKSDLINKRYIKRLLTKNKPLAKLDTRSNELIVEGVRVALTKSEMILVGLLINNVGVTTSRRDIVTRLWQNEEDVNTRKVDVHIKIIRGKLAEKGLGDYIFTVRGIGYRWTNDI